MNRRSVLLPISVLFSFLSLGQAYGQQVITSDIDNFWRAYDSLRSTTDSLRQMHLIQTMYLDKGSPGLKGFMSAKGYTAASYVKCIRSYPKFWQSIRPNTYKVKSLTHQFEPALKKLQAIYPPLRPAKIYFAIGAMRSGGTTKDSMVLIGAELATGDPQTDVSELPPNTQKWLATYFASQPFNSIVLLNIHEYVHTQEKGDAYNLLSQCIFEGACDFIASLATGKTPPLPYMDYGPKNEPALKEQFKADMFGNAYRHWLYNGAEDGKVADLGYYMGYAICRSYYNQAPNKKQAVRDIIELPFSDSSAVEAFLEKSHYFSEGIDKPSLVKAFNERRPYVTKMTPSLNGDTAVDTSLTELRVEFSLPMNPNGVSIDLGPGGRDHYPIVKRIGFSDDKKSILFLLQLKPGYDYGFILTDGSFRSADDYPLVPYEIKFRTK